MVQALTRLVAAYASLPGLSLLGEAEAAREWIDDPARNRASKLLTVAFFRHWLKRENESADFLTLCDLLEQQGQLEQIGGSSYLTSLIHSVPPSGTLLYAASRIAALAYEKIEDALELAEHLLFTLQRRGTQDFVPLEAVLEEGVVDLEALQRREQHLLSVPSARVRGARERCRRGALHFSPRPAPGDGRPREEKYCRHHHCQAAQWPGG
jgi:hypothetical protein